MAAAQKYIYTIGRRKQTTAVVKLFPKGTGKYNLTTANDIKHDLFQHFGGNKYLLDTALSPMLILGESFAKQFDAEIKIAWWGIMGQADAIKLGFVRAIIEFNPEYKSTLKAYGLLKRDPRRKERKKPGLKKARKSPKWSKR